VTIAVFTGAVMTVYATWYALAPVIARETYGSAGVFGLLESAAGVGAVGGAIAALRWRPRRPLLTGLLLVLAWPITDGLFALAVPLPLVAISAVMAGLGFSLLMVWWETALARYIPPAALSRVSAWDWMGSLALLPLGYLVAGPLAAAAGARTVLAVGSAFGLVLLVIGVLPRATRRLGDAGVPTGADGDVPRARPADHAPGPAGPSPEQLLGEVGVEARREA
jgi:MFS family permease